MKYLIIENVYYGAKGPDHVLGIGPQPRTEQSEDE